MRARPTPAAASSPRRISPASTAARGGRLSSGAAAKSTISRRAGCGREARTSVATAAGNDQTAAISQAPHGEEKLGAFPVVGTLVPSAGGRRPPRERGFFFMAYLNLGIVVAVLLVITLWHL